MRLPPVDVYRAPFIEPLGHLALNFANADNHLLELCAVINAAAEADPTLRRAAYAQAAKALRNWNDGTERFLTDTVGRIADPNARAQAAGAISRFRECRERRHRALHDAVDLGLFEHEDGKFEAMPLRTRYRQTGERDLQKTTPDSVAELAMEVYEVAADIEAIQYGLMRDRDE